MITSAFSLESKEIALSEERIESLWRNTAAGQKYQSTLLALEKQLCVETGEDGYAPSKLPSDKDLKCAIDFLRALPFAIVNAPEVSIDADGEVALTWENEKYESVIVVCSEKKVLYACLFSNGVKFRGEYPAKAQPPTVLISNLQLVSK